MYVCVYLSLSLSLYIYICMLSMLGADPPARSDRPEIVPNLKHMSNKNEHIIHIHMFKPGCWCPGSLLMGPSEDHSTPALPTSCLTAAVACISCVSPSALCRVDQISVWPRRFHLFCHVAGCCCFLSGSDDIRSPPVRFYALVPGHRFSDKCFIN